MNDLFVLDKNSHLPIFSEVCTFCRHLDMSGDRKCAAFPSGIPLPIWLGENDHRLPFPDDHNIQFASVANSVPVQKPLASVTAKRTKARKRRFLFRPHFQREAELRARLWQDPQIQERVIELLKNDSAAAEAKQAPSIEVRWLDSGAFAKGKPHKKKTIVGR